VAVENEREVVFVPVGIVAVNFDDFGTKRRPGRRSRWTTTFTQSPTLALTARYGRSSPLCRTQLVKRAKPCRAEVRGQSKGFPSVPC